MIRFATLLQSLVFASSTFALADTFTVLGTNNTTTTISGVPGQEVGVGFTFTHGAGYALLDSSQLAKLPTFATYTDFIGLNAIEVGPNQTLTEYFSVVLGPTGEVDSGLGEILIDPSAAVGSIYNGTATLSYDLYATDPNIDPNAVGTYGYVLTSPITVDVAKGTSPTAVTPEPSTLLLLGTAALSAAGMIARRRPTTNAG